MLDRIRDLVRPPTLRPLLLVIPFFFFVHFSGLTSIRPFMVHVFQEYQMPVSGEWATVSPLVPYCPVSPISWGQVASVRNWAPRHTEDVWESGGIAPRILDLSTRCR